MSEMNKTPRWYEVILKDSNGMRTKDAVKACNVFEAFRLAQVKYKPWRDITGNDVVVTGDLIN